MNFVSLCSFEKLMDFSASQIHFISLEVSEEQYNSY